ncbi:methyltransferase family protein [Mariprofundus micogutta]|uniref:methyltransferase family protein n=1 Tax=Mariprofundus micogutta TaxID=1921010 RepID=UPI00093444AC
MEGSEKNLGHSYDYGSWSFVVINSAVILIFAFSFYHPKTKRDWRSFGAFSAFVIALFTEMYGFPLTIYLLSGWLTSNFPNVDIFSHHAGHLWWVAFGGDTNPHSDPFHILSNILIFGGLALLYVAWRVLHKAQQLGQVASSGIYAYIRHPQYVGFIIIMTGFLLQWPTLPTLVMFPILIWMYVRLAHREEQESLRLFGDAYRDYAQSVPGFIPGLPRIGGKSWKD